jgi:hypothetical protein
MGSSADRDLRKGAYEEARTLKSRSAALQITIRDRATGGMVTTLEDGRT